MSFLTYADAERFAQELTESELIKSASATPDQADVFLSYSSLDHNYVRGVIRLFKGHSAKCYVDSSDDTLPAITSTQTASTLAERIRASPRLVVLVSPESYESRWVPWELGLAHGANGPKAISILPISSIKHERLWARREYLGLYPIITWHDQQRKWIVTDPEDDLHWTLRKWLKATNLQ